MTDDKLRGVTALANRLRLVQTDFGDENAEVRRKFLSEEIERALSAIVPGERQAFLEELTTRFPTWDPNVELMMPAEGETAGLSSIEEPRPEAWQDPVLLATRLAELIPTLSQEGRQAITEQLRKAGVASKVQQDWPKKAAEALASELQLSGQEPLDLSRLLELIALLVHLMQSLEQLAWETWKRMAPRSTIRRPARLQGTMRRFIRGDSDVTSGQIAEDVNQLRRLLASLISAVAQAGRRVGVAHFKTLSPSEIRLLVQTESGGGLKSLIQKSPDAKCWQKYVELAGQITEESIEREIIEAIVSSAEGLMTSSAQ